MALHRVFIIMYRRSCDNCEASLTKMTRFICLECSVGETWYKIDLCPDCVGSSFQGPYRNQNHAASHKLLQTRTPIQYRDVLGVEARARRWSEVGEHLLVNPPIKSQGESNNGPVVGEGPRCVSCSTSVEVPCFYCVDCDGTDEPAWPKCYEIADALRILAEHAFVCMDCNKRVEKSRPWLSEPPFTVAKRDNEHTWAHVLVYCPAPVQTSPPLPSVEERLKSLEDKFTSFEERFARHEIVSREAVDKGVDALSERMERIEGLLNRLLVGRSAGPDSGL